MRIPAFVLVGACVVTVGVMEQTAPQRFRVQVDAVQVDVRVERGGRPVTGLSSANFDLRDSGVPQVVKVLTLGDVPLHLIMALDVSKSVRGDKVLRLQRAARAALASLRLDDRASLVTLADDVDLLALRTKVDAVVDMHSLDAHGRTSLNDALFHALLLSHTDSRRPLVVVFSDGFDTSSWLGGQTVVDDVRRSSVVVYAVTPGRWWDGGGYPAAKTFDFERRQRRWFALEPQLFPEAMLTETVEVSGGSEFRVTGDQDLADVFREIVDEFKSRYLLTYTPEGVPPDGWHPIQVDLRGAKGQVKARRGYLR